MQNFDNIETVGYIGAGHIGATNAIIAANKCKDILVYCYDTNRLLLNKWVNATCRLPIYEVKLKKYY